MDRKKIIYIGLLLIVTVIVSVTYFSYAFFTRTDEQHGKLNVVVGTLTYKLTSNDLTNNSITLAAKEKKQIEIKVKSLNNVASDYKLYYTSSNSNFDIGYSSTTVDATSGTINANGEKTILISIENKNNSAITINFGVAGGFVGKTLALNSGQTFIGTEFDFSICQYQVNYVWDFPYNGTSSDGSNGTVQPFTVPCDGNYKLEVWGAQGGAATSGSSSIGGKGGYSFGTLALKSDDILNIYVGGKGKESINTNLASGGFNGGGGNYSAGGGATGGGASDMRINSTSLYSRVIVAGGGSGAAWGNINGAAGGGTSGENGNLWNGYAAGLGGTQTGGGSYNGTPTGGGQKQSITNGTFGTGGNGSGSSSGGSGGGGGWYGGGGGMISAGGGGSGYIYTSSTASNYPSGCLLNSSYYLTNAQTIAGNASFLAPGGGNETGHSGNGYARITYLGS